MRPSVPFTLLHPLAQKPVYSSDGAIGLDLFAWVPDYQDDTIPGALTVREGERRLIRSGVSMAIPDGYYGRIAPRSGLALRKGVDILAGVIDSDFRGEIGILVINHGPLPIEVAHGSRIAQLIFERADRLSLEQVAELSDTKRGAGAYGSTGVR